MPRIRVRLSCCPIALAAPLPSTLAVRRRDLRLGLTTLDPDEAHIIECLGEYLARTGAAISRAEFEANMEGKLASPDFRADVVPLLRDPAGYDVDDAASLVHDRLIARLPGDPWKAFGREHP